MKEPSNSKHRQAYNARQTDSRTVHMLHLSLSHSLDMKSVLQHRLDLLRLVQATPGGIVRTTNVFAKELQEKVDVYTDKS